MSAPTPGAGSNCASSEPRLPALLGRLPERWRWTLHNLVAHPVSEALFQVGLHRWSELVHDRTVPAHDPGTGRG